jgi:hypothetical protein
MFEQVSQVFNDFIFRNFMQNRDILNYLIAHPRKKLCIEKLCHEIKVIEQAELFFNIELYRKTIQDVAKMFCQNALEYAEQKSLSTNEVHRRIQEADYLKNAALEMEELAKEAQSSNLKHFVTKL